MRQNVALHSQGESVFRQHAILCACL
jgi:hypothetical protein